MNDVAEPHGWRPFTGDRVLWVIMPRSPPSPCWWSIPPRPKMAYDAHTARSTAHFLRSQFTVLGGSLFAMLVVQRINSRVYNFFARPVYFLSVLATVAVYFIGVSINGAARWIPLGPIQFQPSEALKVATVLFWPSSSPGASRRSTRYASCLRGSSGPGRRPRSRRSGARARGPF